MDIESWKQRITQLEFQNRRLSETVEVQKSELIKKEKTIETQIQRWNEAETAILAIQRCWKQLNEDLLHLATTHGLNVTPLDTNGCPVFLDPFVRALLAPSLTTGEGKEASEAAKIMEEFSEEIEVKLKTDCLAVHGLLVQLLEARKGGNVEESLQNSGTEQVSNMDRLRGLNRTLLEKSRLLEDKILKQDSELTECRNQFAEVQIQLQNSQRKLAGYRQSERKQQQQQQQQQQKEKEKTCQKDIKKVKDKEVIVATETTQKVNEIEHKWLEELLSTKTAELEKEKSDHLKTQLELRSMESCLKDESRLLNSPLYKSIMDQKDQLQLELDKKHREVEKLYFMLQSKDQELSKHRQQEPEGLHWTLEALQDSQKKSKELRSQLIEKERALLDKGASLGMPSQQESSFQELRSLVKTSQEEVHRLRRRLKEKEDSTALEKARMDSLDLTKRLRSSECELDRLRESLKDLEDVKKSQSIREQQLYNSKEDLKVFVDVLATCDIVDKSWKESEAKARERNILRENSTLKRKLAEFERPETTELVKKVESYQRRINRLGDERDQAKLDRHQLEKTLKHHKEDLDQLKQLRTALEEELEETGAAYEDIQSQNLKLVNTIKEKESEISELKHQKAKLMHKTGLLTLELENLQEEAKTNKTVWSELENIKLEFRDEITELQNEIQRLEKELEIKQSGVDDLRQELTKKGSESNQLQLEFEVLQRTIQNKTNALEQEMESRLHERSKRQRLEAESKMIEAFKEKIRSGSATKTDFDGSKEIALLNGEIEAMRRCLNCSVCGTKRKSTILMKCMHTFCKQCIDDCIEKRRRRCPGCGTPFSKDDVKPFYLS